MRRVLTAIGIAAFCLMVPAWVDLAEIETRALWHPDHATAVYTVPLHIKGVVRYVTPDQKRWDQLGQVGFWGGWLVGMIAGCTLEWLKRRAPKP
jgi:hypothetical protein